MECGYPCNNGRPCGCNVPCRVHTDEYKERKERERMARADAQSKAAQQEALPKCGWITARGQGCTNPMPCSFHANDRKRKAEEEAAAEKRRLLEALPKCGFECRNGMACQRPVPCEVHGAIEGMKECSSTLDCDPFKRCRHKVKIGELFCEMHQPFPDLGRNAAIYADACRQRGEQPTMQAFLAQHYLGKGSPTVIRDFAAYSESMRQKFAA